MSSYQPFVWLFVAWAALLTQTPASASNPRGEKDDTDKLRSVHAYHILVTSKAEAQAIFDRLRQQPPAQRFAAFKKEARAHSRDPGSSAQGGDLDVFEEGVMVRPFEDAAMVLEPRTVSEPVQTEFGWHLIYVVHRKETPIAPICAEALQQALQRAEPAERPALAFSVRATSTGALHPGVLDFLGSNWGPPLKDWNGDLAYVKIKPVDGQTGKALATVHTEFVHAIYQAAPKTCRRSAVQTYEIDCKGKKAEPLERREYEGRAASGRMLIEVRLDAAQRAKVASNQGFFGQLLSMACPEP